MSTFSISINDRYFTPNETVNQLQNLLPKSRFNVLDPCCGDGRLLRGLDCDSTEIDLIETNQDFLSLDLPQFDYIVMNPPFYLKKKFLVKALDLAKIKVVAIMPASVLKPSFYGNLKYKQNLISKCVNDNYELESGEHRLVNSCIVEYAKEENSWTAPEITLPWCNKAKAVQAIRRAGAKAGLEVPVDSSEASTLFFSKKVELDFLALHEIAKSTSTTCLSISKTQIECHHQTGV